MSRSVTFIASTTSKPAGPLRPLRRHALSPTSHPPSFLSLTGRERPEIVVTCGFMRPSQRRFLCHRRPTMDCGPPASACRCPVLLNERDAVAGRLPPPCAAPLKLVKNVVGLPRHWRTLLDAWVQGNASIQAQSFCPPDVLKLKPSSIPARRYFAKPLM